ncbi:MAG: PTS lactose/cellobiose transporter subunit IIA [Gemella sp.]|nr:PTS lactose/cellobiose transporter subunit IIA [Gemella sp.]
MKLTSMKLIAHVGEAKSKYMSAISKAKESKFEEAEALCSEGDLAFNRGHKVHQELLTRMASGEKLDIDLLLIHSEDQLMSTEVFRTLSREFIDLYKRI